MLETAGDRGLKLATAESCTGGLLASLLTDVEGASHAFDRGFVAYSGRAKSERLGIDAALIEREGAVSEAVARAMAEGAIAHSDADVALAITGFAGPSAPGDEVGLVHFAWASPGGAIETHEEHFGDIGRGPVRIACLKVALDLIAAALER